MSVVAKAKDMAEIDNMVIWDRFADVDPKFTKAIIGKPYKGTSPNPQYVIRCLTEIFGPAGKGFGWRVMREEFQPLGDEVLHWCRIEFWWSDEGKISSFESYGQTMAIAQTKSGLRSDEDAPKKSLTDAIIKAASQIGIAANIFLGRWDDQKYVSAVDADYRAAEKAAAPDPKAEHEVAVASALKAISRETDMESLGAYWADLYRSRRAIADDKRVIVAKDQRKSDLKLVDKVDADLDGDKIPY